MKTKILILLLLCGMCRGVVNTTSTRAGPYAGNGSNTTFTFSFSFTDTSEIVVRTRTSGVESDPLTETTDYSVSAASDTGGTVTFVTAPASGTTVTINRVSTATQSNDIDAASSISFTSLEASHDRAMRLIQEEQAVGNRAIVMPISDDPDLDMVLPSSSSRASKALMFDSSGNVIAEGTTPNALSDFSFIDDSTGYADLNTAVAAIGTTQTTLYITANTTVTDNLTVPSTIELRFQRQGKLTIAANKNVTINGPMTGGLSQRFDGDGTVSFGDGYIFEVFPQWWGAVADDSTDDADAITACILAANTDNSRIRVTFPTGVYRIVDTTLSMTAYDNWVGAGKRCTVLSFEGDTSGIDCNDNITLRDMTCRGDATLGDGMIGLDCTNDGTLNITNVRFDGFDVGVNLNTTFTASFNNCEFRDNTTSGIGANGSTNNGIHFNDCYIGSNPTGALIRGNLMSFIGCTIEGGTNYGIRATSPQSKLLIMSCHIETNGTGGEISIEGGGDGLTVINNTIAIEASGKGINIEGVRLKGAVIQGNRFTHGADGTAIIFDPNVRSPLLIKNIYDNTGTDITDNSTTGYCTLADAGSQDIVAAGLLQGDNLVTVNVNMSDVSVRLLHTTPFQLVAAPGADKFLEFVSATLYMDVTTPFDNAAGDGNLKISFVDENGTVVSNTIEGDDFIDTTSDRITNVTPLSDVDVAASNSINKALVIFNDGGAYSSGTDSVLSVKTTYRVHTAGF